MKRAGRNLNHAILVLSLLFQASRLGAGAQQTVSQDAREDNFLDGKVPEFEVRDQSLLDALWNIARGPIPFSFGFEKVLKKNLADPDIPDPRFSLHLRDKTVREILDALCQADPRFTWSMDGSTANVFPRAIVNDPTYFLNRKLQNFGLKNATDVENGLLATVQQLPPPVEQIAEAQIGGGDPYPPAPWTVTYYNLTVRQVMNRLALHGGPCGIWIFGGAADFRAFGFFNTYLSCSKQVAGG